MHVSVGLRLVIVDMLDQWSVNSNLTVAVMSQSGVLKHFICFTPLEKEKERNQLEIILGGYCHLLAEDGSNLK